MDEVWRSKEKIRDDITKKYNEIESLKHRNDKEAIWAAMHICDEYMKKSKVKENTWMWESFRKLKKELEQNIQDLYDKKTTHRWWGVEKHIERLATRVNEAENEMIRKIRMVNERARMTNLAKESAKWTNQTFLKYDPQRLWMIFTEASNPVKIHEVMWAFFKDNKDATYMLDYKDCKRADIRNKVMRVTKNHTWLCYIKYNEKTWTYNLYDWTSKEQLTVRAEIWDWVRIWSSKERWFINENREQARLNQKKEYNKENVSALYYRVPDGLRKALWEEQIYNFLIQAESRLDEVVKEHQKWWYRLDYEEPITSKWSDNFLMQAKFSWTEWENVRAVFRKDDMKNDSLFNLMKDNKWYVKAYLTERIREKWQETGHYALRDKVINKYEAITENSKVKEMDYWITSLITLVENLEGVHWETTKELVRLEQCLKNIKNDFDKAIKNNKVPTQDERSKMRDKVITLFLDYKSHDGSFASMTDWTAKRYITEIFKADSRSAIQRGVSSLWVWTTVFNNTSREHIVEDIREDIQAWAVEWNKESLIEKPDYDACFKKINTLLKGDIKVDNGWKALINETTWEPEITGNKNEIDKLYMYAFSDWSVIPRDPFWWGFHIRNKKIIKDLSNLWYLPKEVDVDDTKLQELAWRLMDSINHKNYMADNFKITPEEIKSRFVRRKKELEEKNEKSDEEMNELTWLLAILENDSFIEEEAKKETMMWKFSLKYWGFNDIFHWVLSPWLIKEWGWLVSWDNHDIYNDSLWLWGRFDRSDKNSEQIMPMLRDVLVEVAITSVAIAAGTVTMGTATAAIYGARAALVWVRTASVLNKLWKVAKIWRMCVSYWKNAKNLERIANVISKSRYAKNLRTTAELAQDWRKVSTLTKTAKVIRNSARVTRETMPKTAMVLEWAGFHVSSTALHNYVDWKPITEGLNPFGSTYGPDWEPVSNRKWYVQSIAFLWVLKAIWAPLQKWMQSVTADMLWERLTEAQFWKIVQSMWSFVWEMGSMMATEQVLSLTLEQQFSPVTTESMIHMVGMVLWLRWTRQLGKAAKWTIKKYRELANGKGIEELEIQTEEGVVTLDKDWKVIESTDPQVPKWENVFKEKKAPERKKTSEWNEEARAKEQERQDKQDNELERKRLEIERKLQEIQRQKEELTKKKELQEKRKLELEKKKADLERRRAELLSLREENRRSLDGQENNIWRITEILNKSNVVTIDRLKYLFIGVKNGKAEFVIEKDAKNSAEKSWKVFSEKVEVSSLDELSDKSRFNLEASSKNTNSWRYQKLQELLGEKVEPLNRLKNKIKNKQWEITTLKEEIARLEKWKNTVAYNDYFESRKQEFVNKHIELWIDWVKYKASHLNDNWDIQFKEVDWNKKFSISSFKQLWKRVLWYNPYTKWYPTWKELSNHNFIKDAIKKEWEDLDSRNIQETINKKKADLQKAEWELRWLQDKLLTSQARQDAIDARAKRWAEINKELWKLEVELSKVNEELSETERLIKKYWNGLSSLEENEANLKGDLNINWNNLWEELISEWGKLWEVVITREMLEGEFETKIYSNEWVNINWDVYKLEFRNDPKQNKDKKWRIYLLKNWKELLSVKSKTKDFPTGSNGDRIKWEYEKIKNKYLELWLKEWESDILENWNVHTEENEWHLNEAHEQILNDNNALLLNWEIPEWWKNMRIAVEWEFYGNWALKKWTKSFINGLQLENWEYDINWNLIKWEKYQYNASLYNVDSMPINWEKITTYVGHEHLVSKTWEINKNGEYKYPNKGTYNYKGGSEFVWEVDSGLKPKEWKLISGDWKEYHWIFENWVLKKWYEIKLEWWRKVVKIVWEMAWTGIKTQIETIGNKINPWERFEIEFPNWEKFTIKEEKWKWIEEIKDKDGNYINWNIVEKWKIGEYLEWKLKNKGNEKQSQQEQWREIEENLLNDEIKNEIKNKIPDLLKIDHDNSINSEFSENLELHQNYIKTKVIKKLIDYTENKSKEWNNWNLIEILEWTKAELKNIPYEQRIDLINKINSYVESIKKANQFISYKSLWYSPKELFLRARWEKVEEIKNFEWEVTIERFRNSVVFVFEKASDVQRFFKENGNWNHFKNKIPWLDTIMINKEYCKNAEKIWIKEKDAISRTLQHESQHAINEIFMLKDVKIAQEEALNDINTFKEYTLNRVKDEIIAQFTSKLFINKLSQKTIAELSKWGWIKESLSKDWGGYDYFKNRKNTPEGKKAREEYKKEVEKMCDCMEEILKSCKSNEEIQDMLNLFSTTDIKDWKNIRDIVKRKGQEKREINEELSSEQRWQKKQEKVDNAERRNPSENEAAEAIDITNSYQENIETRDGGRFTWELKDWELYKWIFTDKNGNKWSIDKTLEHPVMKEQDRALIDAIWNKESINVWELKRTHRTNFDTLKQILESWIIGNNRERWVQFRWWLGACYWEVALVMKNSVMDLPPAPANVKKKHWNYDYFFSGGWARDRDWKTFQREASDFSFQRNGRGEDPNIDVPYLSIWWKNWTNWNFAHEVGIEHIEAVMLPAHAKNYPWYNEIVRKINEQWIKVIEVETEGNILDYAGWSVILAKDWKRWSFDEAIIKELAKRYPNIPTYEEQAVAYSLETWRLKENEVRWKTFEEIRQDYIKKAMENWFSRWWTRWWQYQNYSSQKNYTREQQAYFKYIVESRAERESQNYPNPQIKYDVVEEAA